MNQFTYFKGLFDINTPYKITTEKVIELIKSGKNSKELINKIRNEKDKEKRNELKLQLPVILFSGEFTARNSKSCHTHSGLIVIDVDDVENVDDLKFQLSDDEFTHLLFISPSGGLKIVVKIPAEIDNHSNYFRGLEKYYNTEYGFLIDTSGKDITRSCFLSYDEKLYYNENSSTFNELVYEDIKETQTTSFSITSEVEIINRLTKWFNKNYSLQEGQRNNNLYILACALSDYGIYKSNALDVLKSTQSGLKESELNTIINSAYTSLSHNFGTKYFEDSSKLNEVKSMIKGKSDNEIKRILSNKQIELSDDEIKEISRTTEDEFNVFWEKSTNKQGVQKIDINFNYLHKFLQKNGFFRMKINIESNDYQLIRLDNNILDSVDVPMIQDFIFNYLKEMDEYDVLQHIQRHSKVYFDKDKILQLQDFKPHFYSDTEEESYLFYLNGALKVSKESAELINYFDLDGNLWRRQIIKREFKKVDLKSDFETFISNIQNNKEERKLSLECMVGYLLTKHKPSKKAPAIILNDEEDSDQPEGGTGKGLIMKAISQLRNTSLVDGKSFNIANDFALSSVNLDTNIFCIDDVKSNFKFEDFFSLVTENWSINKKFQNPFTIHYKETPKIIITTNYAIAGSSSSHRRRRWDIELYNHYSAEYTPFDEFKKAFFDDWNQQEWNAFDCYMTSCLQKYLKYGFIKSMHVNLESRKLKAEIGEMFIDYVDGLEKERFYSTSECLDNYRRKNNVKNITTKGFKIKLKKYCEHYSIDIQDTTKQGRRGFILI